MKTITRKVGRATVKTVALAAPPACAPGAKRGAEGR
jgi:hypothetical protein